MIRISPAHRPLHRDFSERAGPVLVAHFAVASRNFRQLAWSVLACSILCLPAIAQEVAAARGSADTKSVVLSAADNAWIDLQVARSTVEQSTDLASANAAVRRDAMSRQAVQAKLVADQAKAFYTANPTHAAAAEARNVEIFSLIQAAEDGDSTVSDRLSQATTQLRADTTIPAATRVRGIAANEFTKAARSAPSETTRRDALTVVARNMIREFPTEPQGYEAMWALARSANRDQAVPLATELAASAAPQAIKQGATLLLERETLVNRSLAEVLGAEGNAILAKLPVGQPVIVYSWATWGPGSVELGRMIQARRFAAVAVGLDENVAEATNQAATAGLGGVPVYDIKGEKGLLATRLKFGAAGQLYLVDSTGIIRDVRGAEDLESKLNTFGFRTPAITVPTTAELLRQ